MHTQHTHKAHNSVSLIISPLLKHSFLLLEECMTFQGEPERVHMQKVDKLHAYHCYQNVSEPQATEYHTKVHVYNTGSVGESGLAKA